jgi:phosphatidylserine decarboxylase
VRPIDAPLNESVIVSPADSRVFTYQLQDSTTIHVKGQDFQLGQLLDDDLLAKQFEGGIAAVVRLAPQDYHRFHAPGTNSFLLLC